MTTFMVICKSGRLHAIVQALKASRRNVRLVAMSEIDNQVMRGLVSMYKQGKTDSVEEVTAFARAAGVDIVVVGPEEPLAAGVVDALEDMGIRCVGPRKAVARIEWSKAFARELLTRHRLSQFNPKYRVFHSMTGIREYIAELGSFVIKPDGLTGGKGVKVSGDHLHSIDEGVSYCEDVFAHGHPLVLIEEQLDGEEFTFQSFCDGRTVVHTIPIQDHKRLLNGDEGLNTGGMGSYSCADHSLPFLTPADLDAARHVNEVVCAALLKETEIPYRGVLYGGFIATRDGIKVIEFNSRFGDPEVMNTLSLLETDFVDLCTAIVDGNLSQSHVSFAKRATVCKYVVPEGYPSKASSGSIDLSAVPSSSDQLRIYYASLNDDGATTMKMTGSRALAFVGIGANLDEAARIAEEAAASVTGPVHHRTDIGSRALIDARVEHMRRIREKGRVRAA